MAIDFFQEHFEIDGELNLQESNKYTRRFKIGITSDALATATFEALNAPVPSPGRWAREAATAASSGYLSPCMRLPP